MARDKESQRQKKVLFIEAMSMGLTPKQSAVRCGASEGTDPRNLDRAVHTLLNDPWVDKELRMLETENRKSMAMTRDKVQAIVLEAIDMGRLIADPMAIIRGAQELNKMCGFYAPEEKKITLTAGQRRVTQKYDAVSDEDLLALIDDSGIIEAEFEEITDEGEFATVNSKFADREEYDREEG